MKTFLLTASSFNKKSLNHFLILLKKNLKKKQINIIKVNQFLKNKKVVTILASPHIYKTAQEQFEKRERCLQLLFNTETICKTYIMLKNLFQVMFSDIKVNINQLKYIDFYKNKSLNVIKHINFQFYRPKKIKTKKSFLPNKTVKKLNTGTLKSYVNILNIYGDISVKSINRSK